MIQIIDNLGKLTVILAAIAGIDGCIIVIMNYLEYKQEQRAGEHDSN